MSVRFGLSGWDYKDWAGPLYPLPRPKQYRPLRLLSTFTDFMELNASFYHPMDSTYTHRWLQDTPNHFGFVVKVWQGWTHQGQPVVGDAVDRSRDLLGALGESERLEGVLIQLPPRFELDDKGWTRLEQIRDALAPAAAFVEFRHPRHYTVPVLEALERRGFHFVNVDFPELPRLPILTSVNTSDRAYVRLHGRNRVGWQDPHASRDLRYDHHYQPQELTQVLQAIRQLADRVPRVLVAANNHFQAQAPAAIVSLAARWREEPVPAPERLRVRFQELAPLSFSVPDPNICDSREK